MIKTTFLEDNIEQEKNIIERTKPLLKLNFSEDNLSQFVQSAKTLNGEKLNFFYSISKGVEVFLEDNKTNVYFEKNSCSAILSQIKSKNQLLACLENCYLQVFDLDGKNKQMIMAYRLKGGMYGLDSLFISVTPNMGNLIGGQMDKVVQFSFIKILEKGSENLLQKGIQKSAEMTTMKIAEKTAEKTVELTTKKAFEKTLEKGSENLLEIAAKQSYEKTLEKTAEKFFEKTAEKTGEIAMKKTVEVTAKKTGEIAMKKTIETAPQAAAKNIPIIGLLVRIPFITYRLYKQDFSGALLQTTAGMASCVPGYGTAASLAIDAVTLGKDICSTSNSSTSNNTTQKYEVVSSQLTEEKIKKLIDLFIKNRIETKQIEIIDVHDFMYYLKQIQIVISQQNGSRNSSDCSYTSTPSPILSAFSSLDSDSDEKSNILKDLKKWREILKEIKKFMKKNINSCIDLLKACRNLL